jgi:hypothetical protein
MSNAEFIDPFNKSKPNLPKVPSPNVMSAKAKKGCDRDHTRQLHTLLIPLHTNLNMDPTMLFACFAMSAGGFNGREAVEMSALGADDSLGSDRCIFGALGFGLLRNGLYDCESYIL